MIIKALVILSLLSVFYAYFGYPLVLWVLTLLGYRRRIHKSEEGSAKDSGHVTMIITAKNESGAIRNKLENTLLLARTFKEDNPQAKDVQIIVASDHSEDETESIVKEFDGQGVELIVNTGPKGKEHAQRQAVASAYGDIVIFTDAKTNLGRYSISQFLEYFKDPQIGAVSSCDYVEESAGGSGEGLYVRYEMFLRRMESSFSSVVGLSGSCFAVRKEVCRDMRVDVPSDFSLLLASQKLGLRGVHASDVSCSYASVKTEEQEFHRKVRTVLRGITTLFACKEALNYSQHGAFAWELISHKLFRWLVPWFILIVLFGASVMAPESSLCALLLFAMGAFFGTAVLGYLEPPFREFTFVKIPLYFSITNLAIAIAWVKFIRGTRSVAWEPSAR